MAYWLMKSEPDAYSIDDLEKDGRDMWDGIRNYQARNMMRDDMKIAEVVSKPYPDPTQFDKKSRYFDPKSSQEDPRWILVDVKFVRKLARNITLAEIKAEKSLEDMILTRKGNRLSIMPVSKKHWGKILSLE